MKYTEAWSNVVKQNFNLKLFTLILSVICMVLGLTTLKLTFKDSIVIERGCFSKAVEPIKDEHSKTEIENFLREALSQRFDSDVVASDGLLSPDELKLRDLEQKDFKSRNLKQRLILNSVKEIENGFLVDTDRIIAVGEIRSTFRFLLQVKLESKPRSYANPYGLLIVSTKPQEDKKDDKQKENK